MPRLRYRASKAASCASGSRSAVLPLEKEFRFHPTRRWRADFAHLPSRTLVEVEGGIFIRGRHNRAMGFLGDIEKYFEAALAGWRVLRSTERELTTATVKRIFDFLPRE